MAYRNNIGVRKDQTDHYGRVQSNSPNLYHKVMLYSDGLQIYDDAEMTNALTFDQVKALLDNNNNDVALWNENYILLPEYSTTQEGVSAIWFNGTTSLNNETYLYRITINSNDEVINTEYQLLNTNDASLNSLQLQYNIYEGVDLTVKFASEIANYDNEWAWFQARVKAGNFTGIRIHDYIPVTCSNGKVLREEVAGINTYKHNAAPEIGNHVDFISKECWDTTVNWNLVNINNGTEANPLPFMASNVKKFLMSEAGAVPNSTTDMTVTTDVDYTNDGVWNFLPDKLKNVIVEKTMCLAKRYTADSVRTSDNIDWNDYNFKLSKLWLPTEAEVYGRTVFEGNGNAYGWFGKQYPCFFGDSWFKGYVGNLNSRCSWWLLSPNSDTSSTCCNVHNVYIANTNTASSAYRVPVCFRIA